MGMPTAEKFLLSSGSGVKLQSQPLGWEVPQVTDTVRSERQKEARERD